MSKQKKHLRSICVCLSALITVSFCSCEDSQSTKPPINISGAYTSETESLPELPPFANSDIDKSYNLALRGVAFADSVSLDYPTYTAELLNDGDRLTRWLSGNAGTQDNPSFFGVKWNEEQRFDVAVLYWDAAHPAENGFTVEAKSTDGIAEYKIIRRSAEFDDGQCDYILFSQPISASSIKIVCTEPYYSAEQSALKKNPSCYEVEIYNSEDISEDLNLVSEDISSEKVSVE